VVTSTDPHICPICKKPIALETDRYTDEEGRAVHEICYIARIVSSRNDPPDPHHTE
jgi:hypothetical protein